MERWLDRVWNKHLCKLELNTLYLLLLLVALVRSFL